MLRGFVDHPPSAEEMRFVRENRTGNVPIRLQTDDAMVRQIADLIGRSLPLDFMSRYGEGMARVTATDVLSRLRATTWTRITSSSSLSARAPRSKRDFARPTSRPSWSSIEMAHPLDEVWMVRRSRVHCSR